MAHAVIADALVKRYKKVTALDGLTLAVEEGTVLGLLGPNGAGKTTTVRILSTLLTPDAGRAEVAGIDVIKYPQAVREKIGLSGQYAAVDEYLTGRENLDMVGRLYHLGRAAARARAAELLDEFDLADAADRPARTYSGGMRRRLDLAASLVARPPVLFLDEPTTGLDPRSRQAMWDVISRLVASGSTVLLTTQYLEEADRLADRIVVVDHGTVIAEGTADELKGQVGGERIELEVANAAQLPAAAQALERVTGHPAIVDEASLGVVSPAPGGAALLADVVRAVDAAGVSLTDLALRRPSLDDVFLTLTGHTATSGESDAEDATRHGRKAGR